MLHGLPKINDIKLIIIIIFYYLIPFNVYKLKF